MNCGKCIFGIELIKDQDMMLCLVDAQVYKRDRECDMPTVGEKQVALKHGKIIKAFSKHRDVVRAALQVCTGDMSEEDAMNIVKAIYGRKDE